MNTLEGLLLHNKAQTEQASQAGVLLLKRNKLYLFFYLVHVIVPTQRHKFSKQKPVDT